MKPLSFDEWVRRVNAQGLKMDAIADSMHPSAWPEALAADRERFRKLVAAPVVHAAHQLRMELDDCPERES